MGTVGVDMERNKQLKRIADCLETISTPKDQSAIETELNQTQAAVKTLSIFMVNTANEITEFLDDPGKNMAQRARFFRDISKFMADFAKPFLPTTGVDSPL